jgi:hypothetical protein
MEHELDNCIAERIDATLVTIQLRHSKLFTGDLSRLTHDERMELFGALMDYCDGGKSSYAIHRLEGRL